MTDNLDLMRMRLNYIGGTEQTNRLIDGKEHSFKDALKYAYNSQTIVFNEKENKVLINHNKLNPDYEDKIISAPHDYELKTGDIVNWKETNSDWIIYLKDYAELAYFRAYMRRCNALITKTSDGIVQVKAAVIGPNDTNISSTIKSNNVIDTPNLNIQLLISNTEDNKNIFQRYSKFELEDKTWEVQSVNTIDLEGILIVYAQENYEIIEENNKEVNTDTTEGVIKGKLNIKPLETVTYSILDNSITGAWTIEENKPVTIINNNDREITVKWENMKSGEFIISFGEYSQKIIVDSLF